MSSPIAVGDIELRRLAELVADLVEEQRHLVRRTAASEDRRAGSALLPLAAELVGDEEFTAPGLLARALNDRTAGGQALRELITEYGAEDGGLRAFGRLLDRLDGVPLGQYRLIPADSLKRKARDGIRWRIVRVSLR